jgi:hypothetical protein
MGKSKRVTARKTKKCMCSIFSKSVHARVVFCLARPMYDLTFTIPTSVVSASDVYTRAGSRETKKRLSRMNKMYY